MWEESDIRTPMICFLSMGSDPTASIEALAKKQRLGTESHSCNDYSSVERAPLPLVHLEKFSLKISSLSFAIRDCLLHPQLSLFLYGLIISLAFSIL